MSTDSATDKPSLESLISNPDFARTTQNLVNQYARSHYNNPMIDAADLLSEALLAATTAYQSFNHTVGVSFKTYAFPYMRHAVQTYCHKFCHSLTISEKAARTDLKSMTEIGILRIDQNSESDRNNDSDRGSPFENALAVGSGVDCQIDVDDYFFAGFSQIERALARDFLLNDLSIRELANKYNISKSRIGSILSDLKDRMKEKAKQYVEED